MRFGNENGAEIKSAQDFCIDVRNARGNRGSWKGEKKFAQNVVWLYRNAIFRWNTVVNAHFLQRNEEKRNQYGSPINPLMPDIGMATMIDKRAPMSRVKESRKMG